MRVLLNDDVIVHGAVVALAEAARLQVAVDDVDRPPVVHIADEHVPLRPAGPRRWAADEAWVDSAATTHLVGDCDLFADDAAGGVLRAIIRRRPTRITEAQYRFLLEELRARLGRDAQDPLGRARIWASIAPRVPDSVEERALVALHLFERAAPALRAIASRPLPALVREDEWRPVARLAGVRSVDIDTRRLRPSTLPWPLSRPVRGEVPLRRAAERLDTAENRFTIRIVRQLLQCLWPGEEDELSPATLGRLARAAAELSSWFGGSFWRQLPDGDTPSQSFVLRDHADYRVVAWLGGALSRMTEIGFGVPPSLAGEALPITPWSLNVLYERWLQCLVREWLDAALGSLAQPMRFPSAQVRHLPRGGRVVLRLDLPYPRRAVRGLFAGHGKNRPDVAIEIWRPDQAVDVAVLEATYSRSPGLHEDKLSYVRTIREASRIDALTGAPRLATRWAAVAFPGPAMGAEEVIGSGVQTLLSVPPSLEGAALVDRWLAATVGTRLS
jgi:hypothetical protein